jgi:proteic killer suppression protein
VAVKSFRHKGLAELWRKGSRRGILPELAERVKRCLQLLDAATTLADLHAVPSLRTHKLKGNDPERWAISVNGPWRITFEWEEGNALAVDLEQYH